VIISDSFGVDPTGGAEVIINPYPCTSLEAAALYIQAHPERTVGLTSGTFDLFHDFHERYLERCQRALGRNGILIVGVDSDAEVRRVKGKGRPIQSEYQRRMLLDSNKNVTFVYIQDGVVDFTEVCETLLGIRGGVVFRNDAFEGREQAVAVGHVRDKVQIVIVPDILEPDSTTALAEQIRQVPGQVCCTRCGLPLSEAEARVCNEEGISPSHMKKCPR